MFEVSGMGITEAIVSLACTFLLFVGKEILNFIKEQRTLVDTYKSGIRALLRSELMRASRYHCKHGSITVTDRSCLSDMYTVYHGLGGNGLVTTWYERAMELPHADEE